MADQNQNPLAPVPEDEQFMSSDGFLAAESAVDWDALVSRGNVNNAKPAMTKWERDSLYVKFDPLVASRREPSFMFKAPKPPGPPLPPLFGFETETATSATERTTPNNGNVELNDSGSSYKTSCQDFGSPSSETGGSPNGNTGGVPPSMNPTSPNPNEVDESMYTSAVDTGEVFTSLNETILLKKPSINSKVKLDQNEEEKEDTSPFDCEPLPPLDESGGVRIRITSPEAVVEKSRTLQVVDVPPVSLSSVVQEKNSEDELNTSHNRPDNAHLNSTYEGSNASLNTSYVILPSSPNNGNGNQTYNPENPEEHQHDFSVSGSSVLLLDGTTPLEQRFTGLNIEGSEPKASLGEANLSLIEKFEQMKVADNTMDMSIETPVEEGAVVRNRSFTIISNCEGEDNNSNGSSVNEDDVNTDVDSSFDNKSVISVKLNTTGKKNETLSDIVAPSSFAIENDLDADMCDEGDQDNVEDELEKSKDDFSTTHRCRPRMSAGDMSDTRDEKRPRGATRLSVDSRTSQNAEKMNRIAQLKERLAALEAEEEVQKKLDQEEIMKAEAKLCAVVDEIKQKEDEHQKALEQQHKVTEERDQALEDLRSMETGFTQILMMYENMKTAQTKLEKNCEILKAREIVFTNAVHRREERDSAAYDLFMEKMNTIKQDFDNKVKERETENVKLKAKIRMADMKTKKLEGEILQVDTESKKLRVLCDDLVGN